MPDKTSPVPPVAKKGEELVFIDILPSVEEIIVLLPLSTKFIFVF